MPPVIIPCGQIEDKIAKIEMDIRLIERLLDHPNYTNSKKEYDIGLLADKLGMADRYNILYKEWSKLSQGTEIFQGKLSQAKGSQTILL